MKFKWKYISWILPIIILYGGTYLLDALKWKAEWYGFPTFVTFAYAFIISIIIVGFTIGEDI